MGKRERYRNHPDPDYQRWGRTYRTFPGVDECVRLILARKATGAWSDIVHFELTENAEEYFDDIVRAFHLHVWDDVAIYLLMALESAALPISVDFFAELLRAENPKFVAYAKRALKAIDTKDSRSALFAATKDRDCNSR